MSRLTEIQFVKALRRSIVCLATLAAFSVVASAQNQPDAAPRLRGMAISPVMYRSTGHPGQVVNLPVLVQNLELRSQTVHLVVHSVKYADGDYGPQLDVPTKYDCSDWFAQKTFDRTIAAASQADFKLKATVPPNTPAGVYYCLGTIQAEVPAGDPNLIVPQYQIPLILLVGKMPPIDLQFGTPTMDVHDKYTTITASFTNNGEGFAVVGTTITVRNVVTRETVAILADSDRNLYPHTKRTRTFTITKHVGDGQYIVSAATQANIRAYRPISATFLVSKGKAEPLTPELALKLPPFDIDTGYFNTPMAPGASKNQNIKISNQTTSPLTLLLSVHRMTQTLNGLPQVNEDADLSWLTVSLSASSISIPPKGIGFVHIKMTAAAGAKGELWFAVSAVSSAKDSLSQEVYGSARIAGTETPGLDVAIKEIGKISGVPTSVDYEVTNTGNCSLKPEVSAVVLAGGLTPVKTLDVPQLGDGGILPGATLHNKLLLPLDLKPGEYLVRLVYKYGTDKDGQPVSIVKPIPIVVPSAKTATPDKKSKSGGT